MDPANLKLKITVLQTKEQYVKLWILISRISVQLINLIANTSTGNAAQTVIRNLTETATGTETELKYITLAGEEEVIKIKHSFDPNTGCIIDGISTKSLKCIKTFIAPRLCFIHGIFSDNLKIAEVAEIYKSDSKVDPCY